jgi:hypothetical protein
MITNYKDKKLIEYLKDGQKVLIRFGHGLGDTLLFMPIFSKLQRLYPKIHFDLYVESGQEEIFESIKDKDAQGYDHVFHLDFPMAEGSKLTKPELCCKSEIGIEPITEVATLSSYNSPLIAVHFHGTALPGSVGCTDEIAKQIWTEIKEAGKIPIECHFEHCWHNPVNKRPDFVDCSVRGSQPKLSSLIGLLQHCDAFIGVASGPFVTALSTVTTHKILYLEKEHKVETYTKLPIQKVDIKNYEPGKVKQWIQNSYSLPQDQKIISQASTLSSIV